jgi:hypothetical protein
MPGMRSTSDTSWTSVREVLQDRLGKNYYSELRLGQALWTDEMLSNSRR